MSVQAEPVQTRPRTFNVYLVVQKWLALQNKTNLLLINTGLTTTQRTGEPGFTARSRISLPADLVGKHFLQLLDGVLLNVEGFLLRVELLNNDAHRRFLNLEPHRQNA